MYIYRYIYIYIIWRAKRQIDDPHKGAGRNSTIICVSYNCLFALHIHMTNVSSVQRSFTAGLN